MSLYQVFVLGDVSQADLESLSRTIASLVSPFELQTGRDVEVVLAADFEHRDRHTGSAAAYFGGPTQSDQEILQKVLAASVPVIPVLPSEGDIGSSIPTSLHAINGIRRNPKDADLIELANALLECLGLLRPQRRAFVSYRRTESKNVAVQIHDLLCGIGFDVFLDTHDIRPGEPFQEVLWHRLCDSDVLVMLDTPTYFDSKWTRQELGRARAKEIHILRVIWPNHVPSKQTDLAETLYLSQKDLDENHGLLSKETTDKIQLSIEHLRSRSIASRHMSIAGKLRAEVEKIGGKIEGIGAHRAISLRLADGCQLWAYPIVGIPTADLLNDVANKARNANQTGVPILVYDHVGIRNWWLEHLEWLDENIKVVRAIRVSEAAWTLSAWEAA